MAGFDGADDWRILMEPEDRQSVCQHVLRKLSRHYPRASPEDLKSNIIVFEREAFYRSSSRLDYLRKIAEGLTNVALQAMSSPPASAAPAEPPAPEPVQEAPPQAVGWGGGGGAVEQSEVRKQQQAALAAALEAGDWRMLMKPEDRQRVCHHVLRTLSQHYPRASHEFRALFIPRSPIPLVPLSEFLSPRPPFPSPFLSIFFIPPPALRFSSFFHFFSRHPLSPPSPVPLPLPSRFHPTPASPLPSFAASLCLPPPFHSCPFPANRSSKQHFIAFEKRSFYRSSSRPEYLRKIADGLANVELLANSSPPAFPVPT